MRSVAEWQAFTADGGPWLRRRAGRAVPVNGISAEELMDCWEAAGLRV